MVLCEENIAVSYLGYGGTPFNGPHGIIDVDNDLFEMTESDSFTFEIYVKPGPGNDPHWSSLAGTFRARWAGSDADTRYGWGMMNIPEVTRWTWHFGIGDPGDAGGERWAGTYGLPSEVYSYFACVMDRDSNPQQARLYVDGALVATGPLDPTWSFATPDGAPHASFCLFSRERQADTFPANIIPGTTVDALRLQGIALDSEKIQENYEAILSGRGADAGVSTEPHFIRGYCNEDATVNIADGIFLLGFLFGGGAAPACPDAADTNDDGVLNIADAIALLGHLFGGTGPLPAPFPSCGPDETPDTLPECLFSGCK